MNKKIRTGGPYHNPDDRKLKEDIFDVAMNLIEQFQVLNILQHKEVAKFFDISVASWAQLRFHRAKKITTERLFRLLNMIGYDVTIKISPSQAGTGKGQINIEGPNRSYEN